MTYLSKFRCAIIIILIPFIMFLYLQYTYNVTLRNNRNTTVLPNSETVINVRIEENEPIDVVFTWVNGSEARFLDQMEKFSNGTEIRPDVNGHRRFADKNEMKYSLRSIEQNMPWIRHVFIVTNGQVPNWLNVHNGLATVVPHEVIFPNKTMLPTFSSNAIEVNLHRIPGLSKRFLYFNDDFFIGSPVDLSTFYTPADGIRVYLEYPVFGCSSKCPWSKVNNGHCDAQCYFPECQMDGNDCPTPPKMSASMTRASKKEESMFSLFLKETNRVLNTRFGYEVRKVYPHMPIMSDRDVMTAVWEEFNAQLTNTSSHRFRDRYDMQFQLLYTYFMHSKRMRIPLAQALQQEDVNSDGYLDSSEFNTIFAKHYKGKPSDKQKVEFSNVLRTCLTNSTDIQLTNVELKLDITLLSNCQALSEHLENTLMNQPKYKHALIPKMPDGLFYSFQMLTSKLAKVTKSLKELRRKPRKFICLNDDLTQSDKMAKVNGQIYEELANFYQGMFPVPSRYELPPGEVNQFDYIHNVTIRNVPSVEKRIVQIYVETNCNNRDANTFVFIILPIAAFVFILYFSKKRRKSFCSKESLLLVNNNNNDYKL